MSKHNKEPVAVGLVRDHPELEKMIKDRDEVREMCNQRIEFLKKQAQNAQKDDDAHREAYWKAIGEYLERSGLAPSGFKLNVTHGISIASGAIVLHPEGGEKKEQHGTTCDCPVCTVMNMLGMRP